MKNFEVVLTELIDNEPVKKRLTMQFLPRKGDMLLVDNKYKEVVFVALNTEDLGKESALFVNCIGDKEEMDRQILKELRSTSEKGLDWL